MDISGIETIMQFKRREDNVTIILLKIHVGYKKSFVNYRYKESKIYRYHATYNILPITLKMIIKEYHWYSYFYRFGTLRNETKRFLRMCKTPMKFSGEDVITSFGLE